MASACELIDVEIAVDRLEAELAVDLPGHVRAFAAAHAADRPPPLAPRVVRRLGSLDTARRACVHPELADRGLALLRLLAPVAIENDLTVAAARSASPSWASYDALAAARDRAARARFGRGAIELAHLLHGVISSAAIEAGAVESAAIEPGAVDMAGRPQFIDAHDGWVATDSSIDDAAIDEAWQTIARATGVAGRLELQRATVRPRAFIVEPGAFVIVVIPRSIDTPAARFAVLHELGHAVCALASRTPVPRVVDEAVASLVARLMEADGILDRHWQSPIAAVQRRRRTELAKVLDRQERGHRDAVADARPRWSLWHDPGAQAAYVAAEALADRFALETIVADVSRERRRIDLATTL